MNDLYMGLMSGTSLDGVDGVLVDFSANNARSMQVLAHAHLPFDPVLANEFMALNVVSDNELHRAALAGNALARAYAEVVVSLLTKSGVARSDIRAIGAHGQTIRHRPGEFDRVGYTVQVNSPALLAELCGIDVVADLRSRDLAAGGQGAPLVPAFHRAVFGRAGETIAVLNLGGIANLTSLGTDGSTIGFDCGPANALMDTWCRTHTGRPFDTQGDWAASGRVVAPLLSTMLAEPYFALPPPKSTGRDIFNATWLSAQIRNSGISVSAVDVQATLAELTAATCATAVQRYAEGARELIVCGGGAFNDHLMRRLAKLLRGISVVRSDERGLPANQVEACAFAWLARAFDRREPANLPSVTGAAGLRVLGALYPAG